MGGVCWWSYTQIEGWFGVESIIARLIGVFVPIGLGVAVLVVWSQVDADSGVRSVVGGDC